MHQCGDRAVLPAGLRGPRWGIHLPLVSVVCVDGEVDGCQLVTDHNPSYAYDVLGDAEVIEFHTKVSWGRELIYFAQFSEWRKCRLHIRERQ
jgi:hypothetical protein